MALKTLVYGSEAQDRNRKRVQSESGLLSREVDLKAALTIRIITEGRMGKGKQEEDLESCCRIG